jgi:hypothetical protein
MKKIILLAIILTVFKNTMHAQTSFGIQAGITSAFINGRLDGLTLSSDAKAGFTAGFTTSSLIEKHWSIRPELNFTQKGAVINFTDEAIKYNTTFNYLELPVNMVYSFKGKFFLGAGPTIAYALSGKYKITGMYTESGDLKFGSGSDADYKPVEFGFNILAGYQLASGIFFTANYNAGISNISADDSEKDHSSYLGLRIGYMFKSRKK